MTTPGYGGGLRPFARMNKRRYRVDFSNRPFADAEQNPQVSRQPRGKPALHFS
jgi:hypothetical protein